MGDLVREFVGAFRARGMKVGLYYCWPGNYVANSPAEVKLAGTTYLPKGKPNLHGLPQSRWRVEREASDRSAAEMRSAAAS